MDDSSNVSNRPPKPPLRPTSASQEPPSSPPIRNVTSSGALSHRSSFAENLRSHPPSPRSQRHPSFTQAAVQELLNHPPPTKPADPRFVGRDWRHIQVAELVSKDDVRFVESRTGVEEATKVHAFSARYNVDCEHNLTDVQLLIDSGPPNVILVRRTPQDLCACDTFDYNDLNAYILVVLGLANPNEDQIDAFTEIAKKAREGIAIPLKDIGFLAKKAPLVTLSESQDLSKAIESFAGGVHRILIVKEGTDHVIGILSQWTLVKFLWDNGSSFPVIDQLYPMILRDLNVGTHQTIAIK
jgi:CBS domain-containing protein